MESDGEDLDNSNNNTNNNNNTHAMNPCDHQYCDGCTERLVQKKTMNLISALSVDK